jgi:hypothetical protein
MPTPAEPDRSREAAAEPAQAPFTVARLDEMETLPAGFAPELGWKPVRHALGVEAFGINAYVAGEPGMPLIEDHDELGGSAGRHEELYLVVTGRATFTVAGQTIDAPAGTFVAVHDPAARRAAVAVEAGTTALAIGGRRGAAFEISSWEYSFRAIGLARLGRHDEAIGLMKTVIERRPDDANLFYNFACVEALASESHGPAVAKSEALRQSALAHLTRAAAMVPKLAAVARDDEDLAPLRGMAGFPPA